MPFATVRGTSPRLFRIGRPPEPLAPPPAAYRGAGRFDDPDNQYGVIYAAATLRCCLLESLDVFRPDPNLVLRLAQLGATANVARPGLVPDAFFSRLIVEFVAIPDGDWLDVRASAPETAVELSRDSGLIDIIRNLGYGVRIKPGDLVGSDRRLTRAVSRWAWNRGYGGIIYSSSHHLKLDCWAISDRTALRILDGPRTLSRDDPVFREVAEYFGLTISQAPTST